MLTFAEMLFKRNEDIEDVMYSEAVKSGEAVEDDEADEGLPVDSDASISMSSSLSQQWWCQPAYSTASVRPVN